MHGTRDEATPSPPPFEIVLRGFDRQQVTDHVNALKARVASIGAQRDAALQRAADLNEKFEQLRREAAEATWHVDRLRSEAAEAATEVDRLQRSPLTAATARIQRMLQMAEDEAADLRATAEQETAALRDGARAETDRLLAETRQQCGRLETESAARRQAAEQESERTIARRETETDAWVRDYQARSIAALQLIMLVAAERLSIRVAKAKRQVTAARQLRSEVTNQLSDVHHLLIEALGVVDQPTATEQAEQERDVESAGPLDGSAAPEPAEEASGSDDSRMPRRWERPGPAGRPRQPHQPLNQPLNQPTARFGLHP